MKDRLRVLAIRMYGQPPAKGGPQSERLRYVRRFYTRPLWFTVLKVLLVALIFAESHQTWLIVLFAVLALMMILGYAELSLRIRRADRREQAAHPEIDHM